MRAARVGDTDELSRLLQAGMDPGRYVLVDQGMVVARLDPEDLDGQVRAAQAARSRRLEITADRVLLEIARIAFGDLFLADIRAYREALCARLGWTPLFPLFGADTAALAIFALLQGKTGITGMSPVLGQFEYILG